MNRSGETLLKIVGPVKKGLEHHRGAQSASEEQASGIDQIKLGGRADGQVDPQNAAMVEEAASAAESMTEQAGAAQPDQRQDPGASEEF